MRRPILTDADTVVSGDMDLLEALKRSHAYTSSSVQVEDKVRARHRDKCAFVEGRKPVGDGAHGMLADAVVYISTAVASVQIAGRSEFRLMPC